MRPGDAPLHVQYTQYTADHTAEYGPRTAVLMLVGSFYEIYGYRLADGTIIGSALTAVAVLCDLKIAKKQGRVSLGDLPAGLLDAVHPQLEQGAACPAELVMAGFRDYSLDKYLAVLTAAGWTAPVYDQGTAGAPRYLAHVCSPGTAFLDGPTGSSSSIACVWLSHSRACVSGYATINIHTGECSVGEAVSRCAHDERRSPIHTSLEHFLEANHPREVLLVEDGVDPVSSERVREYLGRAAVLRVLDQGVVTTHSRQVFLDAALVKLFPEGASPDSCVLSALRGLEVAVQAFVLLLDTVARQSPQLVAMLQPPRAHSSGHELRMANSSLSQLNITSKPGARGVKSSLLSLVEAAATTAAGRRELRRDLLVPSARPDVIATSLAATAAFVDDGVVREAVLPHLRSVCDVEVEHRRLVVQKATPSCIAAVWDTLDAAVALAAIVGGDNLSAHVPQTGVALAAARRLQDILALSLDRDALSLDAYSAALFCRGREPAIDKLHDAKVRTEATVESIRSWLVAMLPARADPATAVVLHAPATSATSLQTTSRRGAVLLDRLKRHKSPVQLSVCGEAWELDCAQVATASATGSKVRVVSPQIDRLHGHLSRTGEAIEVATRAAFVELVRELGERGEDFRRVAAFLSRVDALRAKAHLAITRGYVLPELVPHRADGGARINAEGLRHPLIELINTRETYVPNDLTLGAEGGERGTLIYGTNAVGKSSLVKAVGMAVVLAQAGFFVPCTAFRFSPFTALYTRILGNDDLFKGLSTFAVEMLELDVVLRDADERSLVLGDELCSGTETSSAVAIFAAGLEHITAAGSCFLFATHLHETARMRCTAPGRPVSCKHMAVEYDAASDTLTYVRTLRDGPGARVYGLEVCRALKMPSAFLERAAVIRAEQGGEAGSLADAPTSRYNAAKLRNECEQCGAKAVETHHLVPQKEAGHAGRRARGIHIDHPANLLSLCEACHLHAHLEDPDGQRRKTRVGSGYALV